MKVAAVFDSSGTLISIRRIIKDINSQKFIYNCQTVDIVDEKKGRALIIIKEGLPEIIENQDPDTLISDFLSKVDWGVSYCNPPIDRNGVFKDKTTKIKELQDPLNVMKRFEIQTGYGSAVIADTLNGQVEYTVATGGCIFPEVPETVRRLKEMGVKVFVASGDSKNFIERISELVGINKKYIMPEAHHELKKDLVLNLKKEGYKVVMIGDASNDVPAMVESDLSIVTLQNGNVSKKALEVADIKVDNILEVVDIVDKFIKNEKRKE